jgi:hypothetical protein
MPHVTGRILGCSQRQDQPPVLGQSIEPRLRRLRGAGADIDDVGAAEQNARTVAVHDTDIARSSEICSEPRRQPGIEFDRRYPPLATNQSMQYRRVVADLRTYMHDVLTQSRRSTRDQRRMQ